MKKSHSQLKTVFLSVLWLAVVCAAAILAITRRDKYGIDSYLILGVAAVMLVLFFVGYLPQRIQNKSFTELLGKLSTGLLILFAILILATSLVKGYKNFGIIGSGVLVLFLITFIRIFISYVKDFDKQSRKPRAKGKKITESEGESQG